MPHPSLGHAPRDMTAGLPEAAARLRANKARLARLALEATVRNLPEFEVRYDDLALRRFLRDYDRHIEQLARALESADDYYVTSYAECARAALPAPARSDARPRRAADRSRAGQRERPGAGRETVLRLSSSRAGPTRSGITTGWPAITRAMLCVRFFWKGAGVGDDKWV